jgi:hypothetical protein
MRGKEGREREELGQRGRAAWREEGREKGWVGLAGLSFLSFFLSFSFPHSNFSNNSI